MRTVAERIVISASTDAPSENLSMLKHGLYVQQYVRSIKNKTQNNRSDHNVDDIIMLRPRLKRYKYNVEHEFCGNWVEHRVWVGVVGRT